MQSVLNVIIEKDIEQFLFVQRCDFKKVIAVSLFSFLNVVVDQSSVHIRKEQPRPVNRSCPYILSAAKPKKRLHANFVLLSWPVHIL